MALLWRRYKILTLDFVKILLKYEGIKLLNGKRTVYYFQASGLKIYNKEINKTISIQNKQNRRKADLQKRTQLQKSRQYFKYMKTEQTEKSSIVSVDTQQAMDETVEYTNACSDMSNVQFFMLDGRTCEVIFFLYFTYQEIYFCTPKYNMFEKF